MPADLEQRVAVLETSHAVIVERVSDMREAIRVLAPLAGQVALMGVAVESLKQDVTSANDGIKEIKQTLQTRDDLSAVERGLNKRNYILFVGALLAPILAGIVAILVQGAH